MDEFRIDCGKLGVQCGDLENYEIIMREMKESVNSVCNGLRHKLSAMDDIGSSLKKIEENLQGEMVIMVNLKGTLGTVMAHYRKTEGAIVDFKEGIASEKTSVTQPGAMGVFGKMFDKPVSVVDGNGYLIGICDENGFIIDRETGFRMGGHVDEHGLYYDEKGKIRGKREDSEFDICDGIVDFGGYREERENSKKEEVKNSDLIFVEWKNYLDSGKLAVSDSLNSWGVPKILSERIADGVISYFSQESFYEAMHDMIVHGDVESGISALANKVVGGVVGNGYGISKTIINQLGILVKDLITDFKESIK